MVFIQSCSWIPWGSHIPVVYCRAKLTRNVQMTCFRQQRTSPLSRVRHVGTCCASEESRAVSGSEESSLASRCLAECVGTGLFVFVTSISLPVQGPVVGALVSAGAFLAVASAVVEVSGAHLNPAISLSSFVLGRTSWWSLIAYTMAQCVGALLGMWLIRWSELAMAVGIGMSNLTTARSMIVSEATLACFLSFTVFQNASRTVCEDQRDRTAVLVGLGPVAGAVTVIAGLGACCNPAKALSLGLMSPRRLIPWISLFAPLGGALLGALISELVFSQAAGSPRSSLHRNWIATSDSMEKTIRNLGLAGLIGYGITNILYYSIAFYLFWSRMTFTQTSLAAQLGACWAMVWAGSQVTKPLRLAIAAVLAPIIQARVLSRTSTTINRSRVPIRDQGGRALN